MSLKSLFIIFILLNGLFSCQQNNSHQRVEANSSTDKPQGMIWIAGGEFMMGCSGENCAEVEMIPHKVKVDAFWIDETEVTNKQFRKFVEETKYVTVAERPIDWEEIKKQAPPGTPKPPDEVLQPGSLVFTPPPGVVALNDYTQWWRWVIGANWQHPQGPGSSLEGKDNHPVVQIAYEDALAYATWAGKSLPTEAQYEFAARGGLDAKAFSWGDELSPQGKYLANYFQGSFPNNNSGDDGFVGTAPVKSFPPNGYGLFDMTGNVWELCTDWYGVAPKSAKQNKIDNNPVGPAATSDPEDPYAIKHVSKGGSFLCSNQYCSNYKPSGRQGTSYDSGLDHVGFRCVKNGE
ncbi:MAG: formylglycine-generating enzyme family protein [Cyclobacteriaceae bacterium]|jgi:formylglycine-generating enzyme|nr:formylglycine-generating enzyme family protein [Cyclobacteriaceae bacterium]